MVTGLKGWKSSMLFVDTYRVTDPRPMNSVAASAQFDTMSESFIGTGSRNL